MVVAADGVMRRRPDLATPDLAEALMRVLPAVHAETRTVIVQAVHSFVKTHPHLVTKRLIGLVQRLMCSLEAGEIPHAVLSLAQQIMLSLPESAAPLVKVILAMGKANMFSF
mmetsp:Transcript_102774/g.265679  ORF Transcript_102774/g.265679 Transcript_102774/m.265679 type:complete len:112 (-) Transcript_102774:11-346(-)